MMTEHTPGPWIFEPGYGGHAGSLYEPPDPGCPPTVWANTEHGDILIATPDEPFYKVEPEPQIYDEGWPDDGVRYLGSSSANAMLIAAAPDLLAACEAALVELEEFGNYTADALGVTDLAGRRPRRRIETQLIRAIRKAKGENNE